MNAGFDWKESGGKEREEQKRERVEEIRGEFRKREGIEMRIGTISSLAFILMLTTVDASAFSDKMNVGPFLVGFTIDTPVEPFVNSKGPINLSGYSEYQIKITTASSDPKSLSIIIDDYRNNTDVSESRLMELIADLIKSNSYSLDWKKVSIGKAPAIMAKVDDTESFSTYSITGYSPDGDGKQGTIVVIIKSFLPDNITGSFFKDLEVQRKAV
jgi:hypothetical protein